MGTYVTENIKVKTAEELKLEEEVRKKKEQLEKDEKA
jgi:hypothetical protein